MIIAENIHKFYENNHILKGINLRVDKGEIISLVGASGAGKTTLLQILGTIDKYDKKEGSKLLLKNQDISDFTENQLANFRNHELGFIFQFHQLLPEFNVIENICIPAFIKKTPKNIAKSKWLIGCKKKHRDNIASLKNLSTLDDCEVIKNIDKWEIE